MQQDSSLSLLEHLHDMKMSPKNAIPSFDAAISSRVFLLWWTPRSMTARRARTMRRAENPPPKIEASEKFLALLLTMLEVLLLLPPPPLLPMVLPTVLLDGLGLGDTTGHEPRPYPMQVFPDVLYATYMLFHSCQGMERNTHNSN
jgi:hypothetical protein